MENADFGKIAIEDDAYLYEWAKRLVSVDGKSAGELSGSPTAPSFIARTVERTFKKLFLGKTLREYERLGKPWGIVISDEFLKFHPEDRRIEIREKVRGRLGRSE